MRKIYKHSRERFLGNRSLTCARCYIRSLNAISYLRTDSPTAYRVSEVIALLGDGVPQEAMSTTCICMDQGSLNFLGMDTQNGKLLNTSQTQDFDIFGRVINNDT